MAEFLTTSACTYQIEQIILTAKDQLFLFSPYLQFSKTMFERLKDTAERDIKITIVYGKSELKVIEKQKLTTLDNVSLYFFENLHAKCYFNEYRMVITSMNIYEFSEKNNREMGILLTRSQDLNAFTQAYKEAVSIVKNALKIEAITNDGHCIRCLTTLKFNHLKPLCLKCYHSWSRFKNRLYIEKYCHRCGNKSKSSLSSPICPVCKKIAA